MKRQEMKMREKLSFFISRHTQWLALWLLYLLIFISSYLTLSFHTLKAHLKFSLGLILFNDFFVYEAPKIIEIIKEIDVNYTSINSIANKLMIEWMHTCVCHMLHLFVCNCNRLLSESFWKWISLILNCWKYTSENN